MARPDFANWSYRYLWIFIFLLSSITCACVSWLTPPFSMPDESAHYLRAYEIGHGHWVNSTAQIGIPILCSDYLDIAQENGKIRIAFYQQEAEKMDGGIGNCYVKSVNTAGIYSPLPYLGSAIGIILGESFGGSINGRLLIARLFNALLTTFLCFFAIFLVKKFRYLLAIFVFLPMSYWLRSSLSADAMTITVTLIYLAYILRSFENNQAISLLQIFGMVCIAVLLGSTKPVYGVLAFSSLILMRGFSNKRQFYCDFLLLSLPGFVGILSGIYWAAAADPSLIYINKFANADPLKQLHFLLGNPFSIFGIIYNSIVKDFSSLVSGGSVPNPPILNVSVFDQVFLSACFFCGTVFVAVTTQVSFGAWRRVTITLISAACVVGIILPLYFTYNAVGFDGVIGVQGRYFIPVAVVFFVGCALDNPSVVTANEFLRLAISVVAPVAINIGLVLKYVI